MLSVLGESSFVDIYEPSLPVFSSFASILGRDKFIPRSWFLSMQLPALSIAFSFSAIFSGFGSRIELRSSRIDAVK